MAKKVKRAKRSTGKKDAYGFPKIATRDTKSVVKDWKKTFSTGKGGFGSAYGGK